MPPVPLVALEGDAEADAEGGDVDVVVDIEIEVEVGVEVDELVSYEDVNGGVVVAGCGFSTVVSALG